MPNPSAGDAGDLVAFDSPARAKGWTKELNLVSWTNKEPKYDLRDWDPTHNKMGKGLTLTADELSNLRGILIEMVV